VPFCAAMSWWTVRRCFELVLLFALLVASLVSQTYLGWAAAPKEELDKQPQPEKAMLEGSANSSSSLESAAGTEICIIILSSRRSERRDWIRKTWATSTDSIRVLFVVGRSTPTFGKSLANEPVTVDAETHRDILFVDAPDDYANLSQKVFASFRAVGNLSTTRSRRFPDKYPFHFVLKVDDDSFVNLKALRRIIDRMTNEGADRVSGIYAGFLMRNIAVIKEPAHPNYEPTLVNALYDVYASGAGYMVSGDVAKFLGHPPFQPRKMVNEDAAMGRLLSPYDIQPIHLTLLEREEDAVLPFGVDPQKGDRCRDSEGIIVVHWIRDECCMKRIQQNASRGLPFCDSWCRETQEGVEECEGAKFERAKRRRDKRELVLPTLERSCEGIHLFSPLDGVQTKGLHLAGKNLTKEDCAKQCCNLAEKFCEVYQWCDAESCDDAERGDCWVGFHEGDQTLPCRGWVGGLRLLNLELPGQNQTLL